MKVPTRLMKTKIETLEEYQTLWAAVHDAEQVLLLGEGVRGLHYNLTLMLIGYRVFPPHKDRQEIVDKAKQLLLEYEKENSL